jgi:hypothetical protein
MATPLAASRVIPPGPAYHQRVQGNHFLHGAGTGSSFLTIRVQALLAPEIENGEPATSREDPSVGLWTHTCPHVQVPNYANAEYFSVASGRRLNLQ